MKIRHSPSCLAIAVLAALFSAAPAANGCAACNAAAQSSQAPLPGPLPGPAPTPGKDTTPAGHPLRGVIEDVLSDQQALLVKHEEIPGVMRAMTMLLKVDAPTLAAAQKGQAITATLVKKADGWWLLDVKPVPQDG